MNASALTWFFILLVGAGTAFAQNAGDPQVFRTEASIVAGNAVTAKKRALSDAFRQAVEHTFTEMLAQRGEVKESPRMQQLKASVASVGQKYIRKYRILEQEEAAGQVKLMVEIEVDTVLLRQDVEKASAEQSAARPAPDTLPSSTILVAGAMPSEFSTAFIKALGKVGMNSQLVAMGDAPSLVAASAKANATAMLANAQAAGEGTIRGTFRISATCVVGYQWLSPLSSKPLFEGREQERATGTDEASAKATCLERLANQVARSIGGARTKGPRAPYFSLYVDAVEPGVLPTLLAGLKRLGGISSTEVRVVTPIQSEIRVYTRLVPAVVQPLLAREVAGKLTISPGGVGPDKLSVSARIAQSLDSPQGDQ